jgi:L-fucose isomerase-like protein
MTNEVRKRIEKEIKQQENLNRLTNWLDENSTFDEEDKQTENGIKALIDIVNCIYHLSEIQCKSAEIKAFVPIIQGASENDNYILHLNEIVDKLINSVILLFNSIEEETQ